MFRLNTCTLARVCKYIRVKGYCYTFGDGALDFGALLNDAVFIDTFLFLNKSLGEAVLTFVGGGVEFVVRNLNLRNDNPLDKRENYTDHCTRRNKNLRREIWQYPRPHPLCLNLSTAEIYAVKLTD